MCGIAGYISTHTPDQTILKAMTDRIAHRGPDAEGFYVDEHVALGHRRLSIIDLNNGKQPMFNNDHQIVIVYNGEIYNYKELKAELLNDYSFANDSDTEVIIHGYEKWGHDVVDHLRGMFAFALWDKNKNELFMARDGWGIKPFYYYHTDETFMFASEIKAFLDHPEFKKEFNESILSAYLCFNSVPTTETFFKGVNRLEPGHYMIYKDGEITIHRYFKLEFDAQDQDIDSIINDIQEAMQDSVDHHQIADVEVGSFLSSGIDSSYLVSVAKPDKTYTVGYDDPRYDEIVYAKDLTEKLGIHNRSKMITKEEYIEAFPNIIYHMDEPLADPAAIALYFVAQIASEDVKVVMSGEGADEMFCGYNTYHEELDGSLYMKIPYPIRHAAAKIAGLFPEARGLNFIYRRGQKLEDYNIGLGRIFRDEEAYKLVNNKQQVRIKDIIRPFYEEYSDQPNLIKRQVIDFYFWLVRDFLHAVDRNTMMFGLEARTPFLDKKVYEVARHLPQSAKINAATTKPALRMAAQKSIPNEAYKKKKLGFPVPLREWIREDDLYEDIKKAFNSPVASRYFDVKRINKMLEDHRHHKKDTYKKVWTIYTFLVWYDQYFA
ncbi:MAG: asparagine synthase (glutamine-hydrolyzing) [Erysipelotrichaceae bacterium]|nr:asparagine synthase (glutamine-hydrolyzing) [Erysipelotrichaceae bacterium]